MSVMIPCSPDERIIWLFGIASAMSIGLIPFAWINFNIFIVLAMIISAIIYFFASYSEYQDLKKVKN